MASGVGAARVGAALDWVFARCTPSLVVSSGFAGALDPSLAVGDVVLPGMLVESSSRESPADRGNPSIRLYCSNHLISTPEEKHRLGQQFGAVAVDMESAAIHEKCRAAGVGFAMVRAISDAVNTALSPRLTRLLSGGEASPWRVAWNCLIHPGLIGECIRLAKHTNLAARNLAAVLVHELNSRFLCPGWNRPFR
jgi:purine-nucleoside phosphorylase